MRRMALMKISIEFPKMPERLVIPPVVKDEEFEELCEAHQDFAHFLRFAPAFVIELLANSLFSISI